MGFPADLAHVDVSVLAGCAAARVEDCGLELVGLRPRVFSVCTPAGATEATRGRFHSEGLFFSGYKCPVCGVSSGSDFVRDPGGSLVCPTCGYEKTQPLELESGDELWASEMAECESEVRACEAERATVGRDMSEFWEDWNALVMGHPIGRKLVRTLMDEAPVAQFGVSSREYESYLKIYGIRGARDYFARYWPGAFSKGREASDPPFLHAMYPTKFLKRLPAASGDDDYASWLGRVEDAVELWDLVRAVPSKLRDRIRELRKRISAMKQNYFVEVLPLHEKDADGVWHFRDGADGCDWLCVVARPLATDAVEFDVCCSAALWKALDSHAVGELTVLPRVLLGRVVVESDVTSKLDNFLYNFSAGNDGLNRYLGSTLGKLAAQQERTLPGLVMSLLMAEVRREFGRDVVPMPLYEEAFRSVKDSRVTSGALKAAAHRALDAGTVAPTSLSADSMTEADSVAAADLYLADRWFEHVRNGPYALPWPEYLRRTAKLGYYGVWGGVCGHVYSRWLPPNVGTSFASLPSGWRCPKCGGPKSKYEQQNSILGVPYYMCTNVVYEDAKATFRSADLFQQRF